MPSSIVAPSSNAVHCDSADALVTNVPSSGDPFPAIDFSTYGPADVSSDNASSLANASSGYLDPRVLWSLSHVARLMGLQIFLRTFGLAVPELVECILLVTLRLRFRVGFLVAFDLLRYFLAVSSLWLSCCVNSMTFSVCAISLLVVSFFPIFSNRPGRSLFFSTLFNCPGRSFSFRFSAIRFLQLL